jgi:hypothetical protein
MALGRGRSEWDHTAALQSQIANMLPRKGGPVHPASLNPFRKKSEAKVRMTMAELRAQFGPLLEGTGSPG